MIEVKNLTKEFRLIEGKKNKLKSLLFPKYKTIRAIDNISLELKKGEIFGLLGPNGAGKTTFIKLLSGLLEPTSGKIYIGGFSVEENKHKIGLMLENSMIYNRMTGYSNLEYFAKIYGVKNFDKRIRELAKFLEFEEYLDDFVEVYSEGTKTKLALARVLIHNPDVILLDEPTSGLDLHTSLNIRNKIKELKKENKTIVINTHNMEEADFLCDRIGILNKGKLIAVDTPKNLKKLIKKRKASLGDVFLKLTGKEL